MLGITTGPSVRRALSSVSLLWFGSLASAGLAFITQIVLARELAPTGYGVFSAALATITLFAPVAEFGVQGFWLKVFGAEGWPAMRWLSASFRFVAVSTVTVLLLLVFWALWGPHEKLMKELLCLLLPVTASYLFIGLVSAKLQLEERYGALSLWQSLPNLVRLLLVLFVLTATTWSLLDSIAAVYALVAFAIMVAGFGQLRALSKGRFALKGHPNPVVNGMECLVETTDLRILDVAKGAWPFGLGSIFHLIYFQSDVILLKYLEGSEAAGIYNVAFTVMVAVYLFPSTIYNKFLLPKVHRWAYHDRTRFLHVYRFGNGIMLLLGVITTVVILISVSWIIPLLFGTDYQGAVGLLSVLAFCAPLRFLASSVGSTLVTQEHMHRKNVYMGIVAIFNVLLNMLLIPIYSVMGAAIATLLSEVALILLYLLAVRQYVFGQDAWRGWTLKFSKDDV